jgi:hypothetical protein
MRNITNKAMMVMGLAGMMAGAAPAKAGDFALTIDLEGRHGNHLGLTIGNGYVTPVVVAQPVAPPVQRIWVPPVYRDVIERVWVPTTEIRYRDVPVLDAWGNVIEYRRESYTVPSGYWQDVTRRELVREGYWQVVNPWENHKKYYAFGDRDDCERGGVSIGLMLEKKDHDRGDIRPGVLLEKGAPAKGPVRPEPMVVKAAADRDLGRGKLVKAGAIKK